MKRWSLISVFLVGCSQAAQINPPVEDGGVVEEVTPEDAGPKDSGPVRDGSKADVGLEEQTPPSPPVPATDLEISEIALFQGVKVPLMKDGAAVKSVYAPVVAARPGLLRVYLKLSPTFRTRELTAVLTIGTIERTVKLDVKQGSSDSELNSTMNFALGAEDIAQGNSTFKVRILGPTYPGAPTTPPAQYPAGIGNASLDAVGSAKLRIVLVPVRYDADGSGRLPDTSAATVDAYSKAFYELYPTTGVNVTVRNAVSWSSAIAADRTGWHEILEQMTALRAQDNAATDAYYLGIFSPAATFTTYCANGCTAGLASLITNPNDSSFRAGVAISYSADAYSLEASVEAATHEVGHLHGRSHVGNTGTNPRCAIPSGLDASYPYGGDSSIGSWGYGFLGKTLYSPDKYADFMGYCIDNWISDYNYGALLTRTQTVATLTKSIAAPGGEYRFVRIGENGNLRWGPTVTFPTAPKNNPTTVRVADGSGNIRNVTGYHYPHGDGEGGTLLVRASEVNGKRIEIDVKGLTRSLLAP